MVIPDSKNDHSALLERFASLLTADDITSDQKTAQLCLDEAVRAVKLDKKLQALITSKDVMDLSDETIDDLTKTDFELRFIDGAEKVRSIIFLKIKCCESSQLDWLMSFSTGLQKV